MLDLSIIIVSFNTKDLLLKCIDSILKASPKVTYEIIVVDNGSTDGSQEALNKIRGAKIRPILHKNNLGFSKANNSGIKKALGEYILLLNSDTEIKRDTIEVLFSYAKKLPNPGILSPKLLNTDLSIQPSVFRYPTLSRAIKQYLLRQGKILDKYAPKSEKPVRVEAVVAAAFLITTISLRKVGNLDERYFMYFEDLDYCRRVHKEGLNIYYIPNAQVIHHHGASGKSLVDVQNQWKRLIPSSKIYHGLLYHYLINSVIWLGQKLRLA